MRSACAPSWTAMATASVTSPACTARLDYLADLGVTAIWLLPFYPSPLRDDGYDIADYTSVHPDYGDLAQTSAASSRKPIGAACGSSPSSSSTTPPTSMPGSSGPGAPRPGRPIATGTSGATLPTDIATRASSSGTSRTPTGPGTSCRSLVLAPLLQSPAGPQLRRASRGPRPARHRGLLAGGRRGRPAPGCHPLPLRARGHQQREPA